MKTERYLNILQNEVTLLRYSLRMLIGRNLLAVGIISVVALGAVFSYSLSLRDTKLSVLLGQLEMFAPLLGIVIFSDLIAGDVEAKAPRADARWRGARRTELAGDREDYCRVC